MEKQSKTYALSESERRSQIKDKEGGRDIYISSQNFFLLLNFYFDGESKTVMTTGCSRQLFLNWEQPTALLPDCQDFIKLSLKSTAVTVGAFLDYIDNLANKSTNPSNYDCRIFGIR